MSTNPAPTTEQVSAVAEQAVEYYSAAWSAYVLSAILFLAIVIWFTRKAKPWWRIPLWAAIAAGSLTPAATNAEQTSHAPAIIVAILGFDLNGMEGFAQGFVPIITWFVGFVLMFSIAHVVMQRWPIKKPKAAEVTAEEVDSVAAKQEPKI